MENKKINKDKLLLWIAIIIALCIYAMVFTSCNVYTEAYTNSGNKHELHKTTRTDTCKPRNLTYVSYHKKN